MNLKMTTAAAIAAVMMAGGGASAAVIQVQADFDENNDCAGYFGGTGGSGGFSACQIFAMDDGTAVNLSPVIVQYDVSTVIAGGGDVGDESDKNSAYTSIDGSEFTFENNVGKTGSSSELVSGDWTYTQGDGDPGMRYWVAKFGGAFRLFWVVDDNVTDCNEEKSFACLDGAIAQTSGTWNINDTGSDLSHITFYDTDGPTSVIPLPAAGWLLLAGIGGLAAFRRRKSV